MAWDTKASPWDWDSGTVLLQDHGDDFRKRAPDNGWVNEDESCLAGQGRLQSGVVRPVLGSSIASFSSASSRLPGIVAGSAIADQSAFSSLDQRRLPITTCTATESSFVLNRNGHCEGGYRGSGAQKGGNDNHNRVVSRNAGFLELKNHPSSACFGHKNSATKDTDMKTENCLGNSEQQQGRLFLSSEARVEGVKESIEEQHSSTATGSVGSADSLTGLHLGKRTYFEDAAGGAGAKGAKKPPVKSSASPKKSRAASSGVQVPRCQVEGCKLDLTSARGYHRRHKVCEMHSKAEKVTVSNQEQRFCQQCSRFHVLAEFDDVKRSCRRRLASHNERRRKPQPDAFALNAQLSSAFHEWPSFFHHPRFTGISSLWEDPGNFRSISFKGTWPRMVKSEDVPSYDYTVQVPGVDRELFWTGLSPHSNEKLPLLLLQSPKGMIPMPNDISSQRTHQLLSGSLGPVNNGLTLSSSSGAGVLSGLEAKSAAQVATRVTDSGRALSLLSAQTRGFDASGVTSLDMPTGKSITLDQFMCENQTAAPEHLVPGGPQHQFDYTTEKLLLASKSRNPSFASGVPAGGMTSLEKDHYAGLFIHGLNGPASCESHSYFLPQQGHESSVPQDVKPTVDLMRILSVPHSAHPQGSSSVALQHGNSAFGDLQYTYDPSFFES